MKKFDPNAAAPTDSGVFGLPFTEEESALVYLPVPWEATTSYGGGTAEGPSAILEASHQVDLFDLDVLKPYEAGLHMLAESSEVRGWNEKAKNLAQKIIHSDHPETLSCEAALVNEMGERLNEFVYNETRRLLVAGKIVGVVGGDHSVPFGAMRAIAEKYRSFGILHFDAHSDTRAAYEGFTWSHASIMRNVIEKIPAASMLVQVGIRDVCEEEMDFCELMRERIQVFSDRDCANRRYTGVPWEHICREIVALLPNEVWISFDIDGLDPRFCPNTGTPVPGGLDFSEANFLLATLVRSGRKIIGFDLNEVAPDLQDKENHWDGNVGARLLYKLSGWTLASQSKAKLRV